MEKGCLNPNIYITFTLHFFLMLEYIVPFLSYIFIEPFFNFLTHDVYVSYLLKVFVTFFLLLAFIKKFELRFKFMFSSFVVGFIIFIIWVLLPFSFSKSEFIPPTNFFLLVKFFGAVFVAPFVEELFTRGFLIKIFVNPRWERVKTGMFTSMGKG